MYNIFYSLSSSQNYYNQDEEKCCKLCNRKYDAPRILSCLHVFCTSCIANQMEGGAAGPKADFDDDVDKMMTDDKSALAPETEKLLNGLTRLRQRKKSAAVEGQNADDGVVIVCPACQQVHRTSKKMLCPSVLC